MHLGSGISNKKHTQNSILLMKWLSSPIDCNSPDTCLHTYTYEYIHAESTGFLDFIKLKERFYHCIQGSKRLFIPGLKCPSTLFDWDVPNKHTDKHAFKFQAALLSISASATTMILVKSVSISSKFVSRISRVVQRM